MSQNHHNNSDQKTQNSKNLFVTITLNLILTISEFIIGTFSGSLSLISDATHNSVDIITLIISYFADRVSKKRSTQTHSYGYKRVGILASLLNSVILAGIAIYIFINAFYRLRNPEPVEGGLVTIVAVLAVLVNGISAYLVSKNKNDLNFKSAYLNLFFDTLASIGALFAGVVILVTKWYWVDSLVSLMIGGLLIRGAIEILMEAIDILLEAVPKNIDIEKVKQDILSHECVAKIADLHIWSINSEDTVLTSVIEINPTCLTHLDDDIDKLKADIQTNHGINHQTIEARIQAKPHED
jgi:cobalt-zinc-cadmium efflux system protein